MSISIHRQQKAVSLWGFARQPLAAWLVLVLLASATGCQERVREKTADQTTGSSTTPLQGQGEIVPGESWDVLYIGDAKVGFAHTTIAKDKGQEERLVVRLESEITILRGRDKTTMRIGITGKHRIDGTPLEFTASQNAGPVAETTRGQWQDGRLTITVDRLGKTERQTLDWPADAGGVFAKDLSLLRKPLAVGESRTVKMFFPLMNVIGEVELLATTQEATEMPGGKKTLVRVECTEVIGATRMKSTLWINEKGEILKSHQPQLNLTAYRTTREVAMGKGSGATYDLLSGTTIKLGRKLTNPESQSSITYKATLPGGDVAKAFKLGPTQSMKPLNKETGELTVRKIGPDQPAQLDKPDTPPTDDDLTANNLVQTKDPRVLAMAKSVAPDEKDPWQVALALEKLVQRSVQNKNFSQAFASAAEVAASREGDCTEHAVLLMALCRARGIPARGAMGLVYFEPLGGFAYHMWTEVWIKDRWVPLDATIGRGVVGPGHIKVADANLKGADAYTAFLPVLEVLGRLKLEVVEAR
jgi:hypothetical protein